MAKKKTTKERDDLKRINEGRKRLGKKPLKRAKKVGPGKAPKD